MTRLVTPAVVALTVVGILAGPAGAQQPDATLGVTAPAPRPTPELGLEPTQPPEERGTREQEFYPGLVRSRHAPAFVTPFAATVPVSKSSGIRVGLSGWTAPAVPFDTREAGGGLAFGITVLWDVPLTGAPAPQTGGGAER